MFDTFFVFFLISLIFLCFGGSYFTVFTASESAAGFALLLWGASGTFSSVAGFTLVVDFVSVDDFNDFSVHYFHCVA